MNINRLVVTGNLTADPEVRKFASGNSLCRLRIASNTRRRQPDGTWGEKPNYFDVVVWGAQGEAASRYLTKGSSVAIDGRLEWREWTTESGDKRQGVEIVAESLQFLDSRRSGMPSGKSDEGDTAPQSAQPDDIPF